MKLFVKRISNKRLILIIYKGLPQINKKKTDALPPPKIGRRVTSLKKIPRWSKNISKVLKGNENPNCNTILYTPTSTAKIKLTHEISIGGDVD